MNAVLDTFSAASSPDWSAAHWHYRTFTELKDFSYAMAEKKNKQTQKHKSMARWTEDEVQGHRMQSFGIWLFVHKKSMKEKSETLM